MIETSRLTIRPFQEQDCDLLFEYLSDPGIYKYEPGEPITLDEARKLTLERSRSTIFWAVVLQDTQKMVGHLYFQQTEPLEFLTWELGYIFNPRFQNNGLCHRIGGGAHSLWIRSLGNPPGDGALQSREYCLVEGAGENWHAKRRTFSEKCLFQNCRRMGRRYGSILLNMRF